MPRFTILSECSNLPARGELEISDVNNAYIAKGQLSYDILEGWWTDAGTFESLNRANELVIKEPPQ